MLGDKEIKSTSGETDSKSKCMGAILKNKADAPSRREKIGEAFALHPLTEDERATGQSMLDRNSTGRLMVMPTHHFSDYGDLTGFRYDCSAGADGSCLPVSRRMFYGHTMAEVLGDERVILELMSRQDEAREVMRKFMKETDSACRSALFDCIPDNSDAITVGGLMQGTDLRTIDARDWSPELPESIGVYHAYLRGYNRDVRAHKMFIVCSGGLEKACDAFCNLIIDVGEKWTAKEIADSEEAWWLRKACQRGRCRLIRGLAEAFGLRVETIQDIQSHSPSTLAIATTDTLEHDVTAQGEAVSIFNGCCDTTKPFNGVLVRMHAAEGYWLFKGANRGGGFGSTFGDRRVCGAFPVAQPRVDRSQSVAVPGSAECVVRLGGESGKKTEKYMCFDEAYFKTLERMQWDRDNGFIELMPIVVGLP